MGNKVRVSSPKFLKKPRRFWFEFLPFFVFVFFSGSRKGK